MATVLIIEDEKEIADTLQYVISSEGMSAQWVSNGADAKTVLKNKGIDLCILDLGLPDCSGFELVKEIRQDGSYDSDIPVLILSARNEEIDRIVGLEIGADDYVTKPFSPREVVARVKAILKRTGTKETLSKNTFSHDDASLLISYAGKALNLTRAEYLLLKTLINKPNQVFSRRQLIENVWSTQHPSDDRAIDTHIKTLRAKLRSRNPHKEFIMTHRGFGYSLE